MHIPRKIRRVHTARYTPIDSLVTYNPLPNNQLPHLDPFLFLNHHGPQVYPTGNNGLPFGPHPHRGMETVTFILDGDIMHTDSQGHRSIIGPGGVQWMRAGRGLIHAEVSSEQFMLEGGPLEILQLWVNLPARFKMVEPSYLGLQRDQIPVVTQNRVSIQALSGIWEGVEGPYKALTAMHMAILLLSEGAIWNYLVPQGNTIFFYVVRGSLHLQGNVVREQQLVEFSDEGSNIEVQALQETMIIFAYAPPFLEPIAMRGPFVMNTEEELQEAYRDYYSGKLGSFS